MTLVLLPGLHGTSVLFRELMAQDWPGLALRVVELPPDGPQDYRHLVEKLRPELPPGELILLGESFSSPLAVMLAEAERSRTRGLVLTGGFCASPWPRWFRRLPLRLFFSLPPPRRVLSWWMLGGFATPDLQDELLTVARGTSAATFAARSREILGLRESECPTPELPTLLLQGVRDRMVPRRHRIKLERHLPAARAEPIDGPHLLLQVHPRLCRDLILGFVRQIP